MKYLSLFLLIALLLTGCGQTAGEAVFEETTVPATTVSEPLPSTTATPDPIELLLHSMSLEDRVGQLFLARCNAGTALEDAAKYQLGGYVLFGVDFENQTPTSISNTILTYQDATRIPMLIAVDEEGGTVTRVSRYPQFRSIPFPSPRSLFRQGGLELVLETEAEKCDLLRSLGIHVNLSPVCDITTQPGAILYDRSLGQSPEVTSQIVTEMIRIMKDHQIGSVLKHFPGYGNNADTHVQIAVDHRTAGTGPTGCRK